MKRVISYLDSFFFEEVSATGFSLMRILWAASVLIFLLSGIPDIVRYYSDAGIMPQELGYLVFRNEYRFTILSTITEPVAVKLLWSVFIVCLVCMMLGIWTRTMTIASVLLLFSFHERNLQPLGGGDTVLRNIGFLLMIAPEISGFSLDRLQAQWKSWNNTGKFLKPLRTHIWPYRLLLWQILIIYVTSAWDKFQGTMWLDGTVIEAIFHHTHFTRWSSETMNSFIWISPFVCFYTLIFEYTWLLMLVPREMWSVLPMGIRKHSLKRWLILGGLLFHWGIFAFLNVGSFPFAMTTGFMGLLLDRDFVTFTNMINSRWRGKIIVLYDGACFLCRRSTFTVGLLDVLHRVKPVDFRNKSNRTKYAPNVSEQDLDRAMHITMPSGKYYKGFDAFRVLSWHLPVLKLLTPLLYLPGVAPIGRIFYGQIAENWNKCAGGVCRHGN